MNSFLSWDLQKPTQEIAFVTFSVAKMLEVGQSMVVEVDNSRVPFSEESLRVGKKPLEVEVYEKRDGWNVEEALKQVAGVGLVVHHSSGL
jgi:hypothetical protein